MSLGNANTSAQARGKNKGVKVRRRKEVVVAKSYNVMNGSPKQTQDACSVNSISGLTQRYAHDGSAAAPAVGDKVYSRARANDKFLLQSGHYKVGPFGKSFYSIEINSSGVVASRTTCAR